MSDGAVQRVLVAGAAGGIGQAIVRSLVDRGCRVGGVDRAAMTDPGLACSVNADLRQPESCARAVEEVAAALDGIDGLVHAVGVSRDGVLWKLSPDAWLEVLQTNLDSAFHLCHAPPSRGSARLAEARSSCCRRSRASAGEWD